VSSTLTATFSLAHGVADVRDLHYQIPGALVLLNGVYSMDGNLFEFKGHVRTEASASQMVTGWKSWLLKPVDPFLRKDGAGLELPISVSGTQGDVHFGLALHGSADESDTVMAADIRNNRQAMLAAAKAKREREKEGQAEKLASETTDGESRKALRKAEKERKKAERHEAEAQAEQSAPSGDAGTSSTGKPSPDVPRP
jgi:hypothetical protein